MPTPMTFFTGLIGGLASFALLTVVDALLFSQTGLFVAAAKMPIRSRLLRSLAICLIYGVLMAYSLRVFGPALPGGARIKGSLFGLLWAVVISRQSLEALAFFRRDLVPPRFPLWWMAEFFIVYPIMGAVIGVLGGAGGTA